MACFIVPATEAVVTAMLHEMATSGVAMALVVTLAWCGIVLGSHLIEKKAESQQVEEVK